MWTLINSSSFSIHGVTAVSLVPVVDVCTEELRSFGSFRGKGETDDQLNIDGSTPTLLNFKH